MGEQSDPRKTAIIFFVIFLILFIILFFVVIWFFAIRVSNLPFERPCVTDNNCLPNEYCNDGVCNAVTCQKDSDCNKTANGSGVCINNYCQMPLCSANAVCSAIKGKEYACVNYNPATITNWINSACVKTGNKCSSDFDCYGGNYGLVCSTAGVCVQCRDNSDCAEGRVCTGSLCTGCDYSRCLPGSPCQSNCGDGNVCTEAGTCCTGGITYNVNGVLSCNKGKAFDTCQSDTDCESGACRDLGSIKVCSYSSSDSCLFTAGTKLDSSVTGADTTKADALTCALPKDIYDSTAAPFCAASSDGSASCQNLSVGAACYIPPYCIDPSNRPNLLCSGKVKFTNPYQLACKADSDCPSGNLCAGGICSPSCNNLDSSECPVGYKCVEKGSASKKNVCVYPSNTLSCNKTDSSKVNQCQNGYSCQSDNGSTGTCQYYTPSGSNSSPPPPPVFLSICAVSASTLNPVQLNGIVSSYCVNGFCENYSGWDSQTCNGDNDCALVTTDSKGRTSLLCETQQFGSQPISINVCSTVKPS
jgi:Cys-rich repeat protein